MDPADACALMCAYGTSHHALKQKAQLKPGETLVVLGAAGSTGIAAIQIGKAMGARVIAIASSAEKQARRQGKRRRRGDRIRQSPRRSQAPDRWQGRRRAFDPVGGDAFDTACRSMARGGRLLVIGFASGRIPSTSGQPHPGQGILRRRRILGLVHQTRTGCLRRQHEGTDRLVRARCDPPDIEGRYPLAEAPAILKRVLERGATGKIVLTPEGTS